jgi:hypothetical protein
VHHLLALTVAGRQEGAYTPDDTSWPVVVSTSCTCVGGGLLDPRFRWS